MAEGQYTYPYPRPIVTVDAVVFSVRESALHVLLIKRGHAPFEGMWALPGGFLDMDEDLETGAARELAEETGVAGIRLTQFGTFGAVHRDPRGRVVTVAYWGLADARTHTPRGADDAADACWMPVAELPQLACDHNEIAACAVDHLRMLLEAGRTERLPLPSGLALDDLCRAVLKCACNNKR